MINQKIYQIGLTMINGVGDILGRQLLQKLDNAEAIFSEKAQTLEKIQGIGRTLANEIKHPDVLKRAEQELSFIEKNKIDCFFLTDNDYPARLRECQDAPLMIYYKGKANLNEQRIISIVGTRRATDYGKSLTEKLVKDLSDVLPDTLIVSGLAYGIDIISHRSSIKNELSTVAVLAHGLDRIYPGSHRSTAIEMLENGGLLTDFPSGTTPDKPNFIKRNRIIAGLSDAVVVVESADKGGSLITADMAFSYGRDVFAFPGRTNDLHSCGCNQIIRQNKAGLITSADDLVSSMCWNTSLQAKAQPQQTQIPFPEDADSKKILTILKEKKEAHINDLAIDMDLPVYQLSNILFELEMDGYIKAIPGSKYKLV